jgi:hypothetical protein
MRSCFREGLTPRIRKAARLMFLKSDEDIAKEFGVQIETVEEWRERTDVKAELQRLHREYRASAGRIATRKAHDAAIKLGEAIEKGDPKVLLDTLKAADAFDYSDSEEVGEGLQAIFRRIGDERSGEVGS